MAKGTRKKKAPPKGALALQIDKPIEEVTGTEAPELQQRLLMQAAESLWLPDSLTEDEQVERIQSAVQLLQGIKPKDEIEGMLATQMVATHHAAMECLRRAMISNQTFEGREQNLRHAAKLLSIYSRQIEVLNKHRGKGQQRMTVEYVNVEAGGQAVVGHVESGTTDRSPKRANLKGDGTQSRRKSGD